MNNSRLASTDAHEAVGRTVHQEWLLTDQTVCICHPGLPAGPVNIHERVLRAMNVPGQNHRDPFFAPFFKDLLHDSK